MNLPHASHSWLIILAFVLGSFIDLISALPGAPPEPLDTTQPAWSLTPTDFVALSARNKGIWPAQSPEPIMTQAGDFMDWLPANYAKEALATPSGKGWTKVSFPHIAHTPLLGSATVTIAPTRSPERTTPCKQVNAQKFQCAPQGWAHVGQREVLVQGKKVTCIWAHPLNKKITTITYPNVTPPSTGEQFVLAVAFHDNVTKDSPNTITWTTTHGKPAVSHTSKNTRRGWQTFPIESGEETTSLELSVQATKPGRHQLCYRLMTKPNAKADAP